MFPDRSPEASMNPTYSGIGTEHRPQQQQRGPVYTGHDKVLLSIKKDGRQITVKKCDGDEIRGRLVAHDNYTLSIDDGNVVRVVFKHAIDEFYAQRRAS